MVREKFGSCIPSDLRIDVYINGMPPAVNTENIRAFVAHWRGIEPAREKRPLLCDSSIQTFCASYRGFLSQRRSDLEILLAKSNDFLHPFADPLSSDLLMPFLFQSEREETYSAALEWLIRRLPPGAVGPIFGLCNAGPDVESDWEVRREVPIEHAGERGRLDLGLWCKGRCYAVIEVKTKSYREEELVKHDRYNGAIRSNEDLASAEKIFLAPTDEGFDLRDFQFRPWRQICIGLRRSSPLVIQARPAPEAALFLAILGAIEQNLLDLRQESNTLFVFNYLDEVLRGDADVD